MGRGVSAPPRSCRAPPASPPALGGPSLTPEVILCLFFGGVPWHFRTCSLVTLRWGSGWGSVVWGGARGGYPHPGSALGAVGGGAWPAQHRRLQLSPG